MAKPKNTKKTNDTKKEAPAKAPPAKAPPAKAPPASLESLEDDETEPRPMKTNEVKKGMIVDTTDGRHMEVMDNARGSVRMVRLHKDHGAGTDYAWKWTAVEVDGVWHRIELTPEQIKEAKYVRETTGQG